MQASFRKRRDDKEMVLRKMVVSSRSLMKMCVICVCFLLIILIYTWKSSGRVRPLETVHNHTAFTTQALYGPVCFSLLENLYFWHDVFYFYVQDISHVNPADVYGTWQHLDPRPFRFEVVTDPPWPRNTKVFRFTDTSIMLGDPFPKLWLEHYFHFMELISVLWAATTELAGTGDIPHRFVFPDRASHDGSKWVGGMHATNWHVAAALYPAAVADILYQDQLAYYGHLAVVRFDRVFAADRAACFNGSELNRRLNTSPVSHCRLARHHSSALVQTMYRSYGIQPVSRAAGIVRVTVVDRTKAGTRVITSQSQDDMLKTLNASGRYIARAVSFEDLSFVDQIQVMSETDILIGVHGNGMTHTLWLPDSAYGVVELFPHDFRASSIHSLAALRNLQWVGLDGSLVFREYVEPAGDRFSPVPDVDIPLLVELMDRMVKDMMTTPLQQRDYCPS